MKLRKGALRLGVTMLAAGLAIAPSAGAMADVDPLDPYTGHVRLDTEGFLFFDGGIGDNRVRIVPDSYGRVRVLDDNYPILPGGGCIDVTDHEVQCTTGATKLSVDGHSGNDTIVNLLPTNSKINARMFGGAGDDVLYGGPGVQWISGGLSPNDLRLNGGNPDKGNDRLFGGCEQQCADAGDLIEGSDGNDGLDGGPGNDEFRGGPGTDTYVGGIGNRDMVTYAEHVVPVNASLNGVADDGARGELENLPNDVEDLYGGWSNDTLIGNASDNTLDGGPSGSDTLIGMNGVDWLYGGPGGDELYGDFNNANRLGMDDYLYGGPGYDLLVGEWGYDHAREHEYDEGYDTCQSTEFVDYDDCERILPWP